MGSIYEEEGLITKWSNNGFNNVFEAETVGVQSTIKRRHWIDLYLPLK